MSLRDYRIVQGDTLQSIAQNLLGNADGWRRLATLNRLRAPYISDAQRDQYGNPFIVGTLPTAITAGATTYTLPLPVYASTYAASNVFYVENIDGTYDALTLSIAANETTGLLTFSSAFTNSYTVGTAYYLFPPTAELRTYVLKTADILRVPGTGGSDAVAQTVDVSSTQFTSLLGTDLLLTDGKLSYDANGKLSTVSGTKNLAQAIQNRLNTPLGDNQYVPTYGNGTFNYIGHNTTPYFLTLVESLLRKALTADPRIEAVSALAINQKGNALFVDTSLAIRSASTLLRLDNLVLQIGG